MDEKLNVGRDREVLRGLVYVTEEEIETYYREELPRDAGAVPELLAVEGRVQQREDRERATILDNHRFLAVATLRPRRETSKASNQSVPGTHARNGCGSQTP